MYSKNAIDIKKLLTWRDVKNRNTIEDFENYLERYPSGEFLFDVKHRLEPQLWEYANQEENIKQYDHYLKSYPNGRWASSAHEKRKGLLWTETKRVNSIESYQYYLNEYPGSQFENEAQSKLEFLTWDDANLKNSVEGYQGYINTYPKGEFLNLAKSNLIIMKDIRALKDDDEQVRLNAAKSLAKNGKKLNKAQVDSIVDILRNGTEQWSEHLYSRGHCDWYKDTTVKYYAANVLPGHEFKICGSKNKKRSS